jgi:hypothetical protein
MTHICKKLFVSKDWGNFNLVYLLDILPPRPMVVDWATFSITRFRWTTANSWPSKFSFIICDIWHHILESIWMRGTNWSRWQPPVDWLLPRSATSCSHAPNKLTAHPSSSGFQHPRPLALVYIRRSSRQNWKFVKPSRQLHSFKN